MNYTVANNRICFYFFKSTYLHINYIKNVKTAKSRSQKSRNTKIKMVCTTLVCMHKGAELIQSLITWAYSILSREPLPYSVHSMDGGEALLLSGDVIQ